MGMTVTLAQSLVASPRAICHVGKMVCHKAHELKETVTPSSRLLYLAQGKLAYHYDNQVVEYQAGQIWLVPELTRRHWQSLTKHAQLYWIEFVHLVPMLNAISNDAVKAHELDAAMFQRAIDCWEIADAPSQLELSCLLETLLVRFGVQVNETQVPAVKHTAVAKVLSWLGEHLDQPIALEHLHEIAQLSANHFRKVFKHATQMSPTQYVQMLRLRKARYLLVTTAMTVQEVAYAMGYEDPGHFSKQYRQCWGMSPKQDRVLMP